MSETYEYVFVCVSVCLRVCKKDDKAIDEWHMKTNMHSNKVYEQSLNFDTFIGP